MPVVIKVDVQDEVQPAVLKLFDNRFAPDLREHHKAGAWSEELEVEYHTFLRSEDGQKFCEWLEEEEDESEEETESVDWTVCQNEAAIRSECCEYFKAEVAAYEKLVDLQGNSITKLLAVISMRTEISTDPKLQEHTVIHGILLSYCDGFNLSLLAHNAPKEDWQSIGDQAVALINLVSDHGLLNEDVQPQNCIVTRTSDSNAKYKLFLIDFAMSRVRKLDEPDSEWSKDKCQWDEEGRVGQVINIQLGYTTTTHLLSDGDSWEWTTHGAQSSSGKYTKNTWRGTRSNIYVKTYGYPAKTHLSSSHNSIACMKYRIRNQRARRQSPKMTAR
jgi:hypothetical protein